MMTADCVRSASDKDKIALFPYKYRKFQKDIVEAISKTLENGGHLAFESGTGSGKTVCALAPSISFAMTSHKRILYLVRTNAQEQQVVIESRRIRKLMDRKMDEGYEILCLPIQGRRNLCSLARENPDMSYGNPEELAMMCSHRRRITREALDRNEKTDKGCEYYAALHYFDKDETFRWIKDKLPTAEEFAKWCAETGMCAYEAVKPFISQALIIVAPYIYFFDPKMRQVLLERMGADLDDLIIIMDEAHNLPEFCRELMSAQLTENMLKLCEEESREYRDPEIFNGTPASVFCVAVQSAVRQICQDWIPEGEEDGIVPHGDLERILMSSFRCTSNDIKNMCANVLALGEAIRDDKKVKGKLPRSYLRHLGMFLLKWMDADESQYAHLASFEHKRNRIEMYCLDPSVAAGALTKCHSSISMSGTLSPLEEYRDSLGLPVDTGLYSFGSPFPPENRLIIYDPEVSTRYEELDDELIKELEKRTASVCNHFQKNIGIFFPSFSLMQRFIDDKTFENMNRGVHVEKQAMRQEEIMDLVKSFKGKEMEGGILCSVMGGRISEGLDFPGKTLEIEIIVGLPYPKPTARQRSLQNYYDVKFGKGFEYAFYAPTARRLLQTIGRLIRTENDRGVAVILDKRATNFKRYCDMEMSKEHVKRIKAFFGG